MSARALAFVVACSFVLGARAAQAESSIWERARNPAAARADRALTRIELVLDGANEADDPAMIEDLRKGALAIAEMSGARMLGDPRLMVLLARTMLNADIHREAEAEELLRTALAELAPERLWLEADIRLLLAFAARSDARRAIAAVERALPLAWDDSERAFLFRERAEARMAQGDLRGSVADARAALWFADSPNERALGRFWLGLALERSGDLPAALQQMRLGRLTLPGSEGDDLLEASDTFVLRPLDVDYAVGLAARAMAEGELSTQPRSALASYERAVQSFARYAASVPREDPWLGAARSQRAVCERALEQLRQRLGPPPAAEAADKP